MRTRLLLTRALTRPAWCTRTPWRRLLLTLAALAAVPAPAAAQSTTQVVEYYHTDAIGSVRAVTKQMNGQWQATRHDFMPFGDEVSPQNPPQDKRLFTGKERDSETGQDYFEARYYRANLGRFGSPDPVVANTLRLVSPARWNLYGYAKSSPLSYVDVDGRDAAYVNFSAMANGYGHAGMLAIRADGTATYSRSGPAVAGRPFGQNQVRTTSQLPTVEFAADGLPTKESYTALAVAVAQFEGADPSTVGIAYFKTGPAETAALESYISQQQRASDNGQAGTYFVWPNSCKDYAIRGLVAGRALERRDLAMYPAAPNDVWRWIVFRAADSQSGLVPKGSVTTSFTYCIAGSPGCKSSR
jgi:RHS repeat-associated protein